MAIDPAAAAALKVLDRAEDGIWLSLEAACRAYAIGLRAKPIVDRHFTPGNAERYGFAPLSRPYFLAKQRGIVSHRGASHFLSPAEHARVGSLKGAKRKAMLDTILHGRQGGKMDPNAGFRSSTGTMTGIGAGKNLPTLVLTGKLRQAVAAKNATIVVNRSNGVATITFHGLPEYALYLHEGTPRMPARSPVEPSADDIAMMRKAAAQFYNDFIGKARANPIRQPTNAR
jgi:hypothetical protein